MTMISFLHSKEVLVCLNPESLLMWDFESGQIDLFSPLLFPPEQERQLQSFSRTFSYSSELLKKVADAPLSRGPFLSALGEDSLKS